MAIPVGAFGRSQTSRKGGGRRQTASSSARRGASTQAQSYSYNRGAQQSYLNDLAMMMQGGYGQGGGGGGGGFRSGGGGGGGYGYGGGGGGGPSAYDTWQIQQEKERQARLEAQKAKLTGQLRGARGQALPLLNRYSSQYGKDIKGIFGQNKAQNKLYQAQLSSIMKQMLVQTGGLTRGLQTDLQGQGAGSPELRAIQQGGNAVNAGTNFLGQNAQAYNTRLAQVMANAFGDARATGAGIKASSKGNLENSYAQLLGQIGLIGLT